MSIIKERINNIRQIMQECNVNTVIIPTGDPHISEYPPEYWCTREWISGFTGSAGTMIITGDKAVLRTDGRYYIQAEQQLKGTGIKLQKAAEPDCPSIEKWLQDNLQIGDTVGCDGRQFSVAAVKKLRDGIKEAGMEFKTDFDPISAIWKERPALPDTAAFIHQMPFCGKTTNEKIKMVREKMRAQNASHYLVSSLDAVAWVLNIRGYDIPYTPLVLAFVLISNDNVICFLDKEKCPAEVDSFFDKNGIERMPYQAVKDVVGNLDDSAVLFIDSKKTSAWLYDAAFGKCKIKEGADIIQDIKAVKSDEELANLRNCINRDCVKVAMLADWVDDCLNRRQKIKESDVSRKINELRESDERYLEPSFQTIAAYGEHAALMHYTVTPDSDVKIERAGFLLVDTGGQYYDGTTDITRTMACGELSEQQRVDYTLVLKAHIALSRAVFIKGTCGPHLDILARGILAREGIDYRCGTGHSVGYCLNVHEGPHGISNGRNMVPLRPGMIVTNEPGIYREGQYGIRIENTLVVCEYKETEFGIFYAFEILSYCPIDTRPVIQEMLTDDERIWLDEYHKKCCRNKK